MASIPRIPAHLLTNADPKPNPSSILRLAPGFLAPPRRSACRCRSSASDRSPPGGADRGGWESLLHDAVKSAVKRWEDYVRSHWNESKEEGIGGSDKEVEGGAEWDWERWKRHFADVEEEERIVAVLKSQLRDAVIREDYEDAAKLKLAISTALKNDTVGTAILDLNRAINEERYSDAAFIRDHAGAGLVGWWAGISEDSVDPYGRIIQIKAEHKRYVARSYSSRSPRCSEPTQAAQTLNKRSQSIKSLPKCLQGKKKKIILAETIMTILNQPYKT